MANRSRKTGSVLRDMLTIEHLVAGRVLHLLYWAGLGVAFIMAAGIVGAAVALGMREGNVMGFLLAFPTMVLGLLMVFGLVLVWRLFCEFCNAIFRISEDLRELRLNQDSGTTGRQD